MSYNLINYCEIDSNASQSYSRIHKVSESLNLGDITKINAKNISDFDMLVGGSPCFIAGTLVYTSEGYKKIEDIQIGDLVLTHKNRFMPVDKTGHDYDKNIYELKANGCFPILTTLNHPFLITTRKTKHITKDGKLSYCYEYSEPVKKKLENIDVENDYLCSPILKIEENPYNLNEEQCFVLGRYLATGRKVYNNYIFSMVYHKSLNINDLLIKYCKLYTQYGNNIVYSIKDKTLIQYLDTLDFGNNILNKKIPNDILNLPNNLLKVFLEGFFITAGTHQNNNHRITNISKNLILTLKIAVQKVYKTKCNVSYIKRDDKYVVLGRIVNQHDTYSITFSSNKQNEIYLINENMIAYPIKSIKNMNYKDTVYNLEVHEDHTYNVQMNICFNCTDFSCAGQQKGSLWTCLDCGYTYNPIEQHFSIRDKCPNCKSKNLERTASSLIVEYLRVLREKKPKFCIYENVKNLIGKNFKKTFNLFIKELDEYGYNVYYKVLNAKDYGIPQNRERVILVAIRKDLDNGNFKYPEPFDNGLRLKDLLATNIDDKFYIPKEKTEKLLENLDEDKKLRLFESINCINNLGLLELKGRRQCRCVSGVNGISPTLTTMCGGQQEPKILISDKDIACNLTLPNKQLTDLHTLSTCSEVGKSSIPFNLPICCASRGRNPDNPNNRIAGLPTKQRIEINENNTSNTLTSVQKDNWIIEPCILHYERNEYGKKIRKEYESGNISEKMGNMRDLQMREDGLSNTLTTVQKDNYLFEPSWFAIRKLIPLECFRLMGFSDEDFFSAKYYTKEEIESLPKNRKYKKEIDENGQEQYVILSDSQAYKQAGNSIVVNVLFEVYKELYKAMPYLFDDLKLVSLFSGIGAFEKALDMLYKWINENFPQGEVK